jgi:hypothetical protein
MPDGLMLSVQLDAPAGVTALGERVLGADDVDVVADVTRQNAADLGMTYRLTATAQAGSNRPSTRTVTYTITAGL